MAKPYNFTVTGIGTFPVDMLRYDTCWPHRPDDAEQIAASFRDRRRRHTVNLAGHAKPTALRWLSFGWRVL